MRFVKASYTSSLRPHTLVAKGLIHYTLAAYTSSVTSLSSEGLKLFVYEALSY